MIVCYIEDTLLNKDKCCFNGCLIPGLDNDFYFFFRTTNSIPDWFNSWIQVVKFHPLMIEKSKSTFALVSKEFVHVKEQVKTVVDHGEDPRAIYINKSQILLSFNVVPTIENLTCDVHSTLVDVKTLNEISGTRKTYPLLNSLQQKQKNWTFFMYKDEPLILYSLFPRFTIYNLNEECVIDENWEHPFCPMDLEIRGGAPPLKIGNEFWVFCHSKHYRIFVCTFCIETLKPQRISSRPLIYHNDTPKVHFPCGAIVDDKGQITVSMGVNDCMSAFLNTSVREVNSMLLEKR